MTAEDEERLMDDDPTAVNIVSVNNDVPQRRPRSRIVLELPLFLFMVGISLAGTAVNNIILYRACVHTFDYSREECKVFLSLDKNNQTHIEKDVQRYVTTILTVKSVIEAFIPAILSMFIGVWSDRHGRKPLLVWPLLGTSLSSMLVVVYCIFDDFGPWWFILTAVPYALSGGYSMLITGAYCYMSDTTALESRSIRIAIMEAMMAAGTIVGSLLSAKVLELVGNTWLLVISSSCLILAYAFTNIALRESLVGAIQSGITSVFDVSLVKEMVRECFKSRPNYGRAQLLLLAIANSLSILIFTGLFGLEYLYTREKLSWTLRDYNIFSATNTLFAMGGATLGIIILQKLLGIGDLLVSNIAFVSSLGEYVIRILAISTWYMYFGTVIGSLKGLSGPLMRSFLTKTLPVTDTAKIFAILSTLESISMVVAPIMYNSLYSVTIATFPGAIYVLSSGITGICIVCITIVQFIRRNDDQEYQQVEHCER